jgi:hypothetical protein
MQYIIKVMSATKSDTTTILNFNGLFFVAVLLAQIVSALSLRPSTIAFMDQYLSREEYFLQTSKPRPELKSLRMTRSVELRRKGYLQKDLSLGVPP